MNVKVLHVTEGLWAGGSERVLVRIMPALRDVGVDSDVLVLAPPYTLEPEIQSNGFTVHRLPKQNKWNMLSGARHVSRIANETGADIVHSNLLFPSVYTSLARQLSGGAFATCVTFHNMAYAPGCNKPGLGLEVRKQMNRISSRWMMDGLFAVSDAVARHYREVLGLGDISIVPNPISIAEIEGVEPAAISAWPETADAETPVKLILPGRIVPEKGHIVLLDALGILKDKGVSFICLLAGEGPLREQMQAEINRRELVDRVQITGILQNQDLLALVKSADIALIPSLFEGFGITAAEAMCLERPVIASRTGGLTSLVTHGETGLLVEPGDPGELAAAIIELVGDPDKRARLGRKAHDDISIRCDVTNIAEQMKQHYTRLLSGR